MSRVPRPLVLASATAAALLLAACGGTSAGAAGGADGPAGEEGLQVVAAFYPLEFLATRVGGDRASVTALTPPGAEPHDLELSPQALTGIEGADLVVSLGGFQPAVDAALAGGGTTVLDLAPLADRPFGDEGTDPHFWTDPALMAEAAGLVAEALAEADPEGADTFADNAEQLVGDLDALGAQADDDLASCEVTTLVTAHDAFGYLADRVGMTVRSINGISPDAEPDAGTLAEIADFVQQEGVTTVYTETLVSSEVADTVAAEAGVETAVLDPVEGLSEDSAGEDYLEVMRANIEAVRAGQACS